MKKTKTGGLIIPVCDLCKYDGMARGRMRLGSGEIVCMKCFLTVHCELTEEQVNEFYPNKL